MTGLLIRPESMHDREGVFAINAATFESDAEAHLVDRLRSEVDPYLGLVAILDGDVVGHIAFSPVRTIPTVGEATIAMGLAPMAVSPTLQRRGIGTRLITAGLDQMVGLGQSTVFVLGHPEYYPRFGFSRADAHGWSFSPGAEHAFFVRGPVPPGPGVVRYHEAFGVCS